ncbi:MAG: S8 family serine peptidase [Synergistaceae bacterium]|jgi:subtilisin family serine protease|nr:S8 family serine peptidase [Synergistaceae bacterium]
MKAFRTLAALFAAVFLFPVFSEAEAARYVEGEALVVMRGGTSGAQAMSDGYVRSAAEAAGARVARTYSAISELQGKVIVHVKSDTKTTEELIASLKENPNVLSATPNYINRALRAPNDPYYQNGSMWGMKRIGAEKAWDTTTGGGKSIYAAVMDTGVDVSHPDLAGVINMDYSRNFDTKDEPDKNVQDNDGHGTHVTGTVAALGDNGVGVVGVNWNTQVIFLKVFTDEGAPNGLIIAGLNYLADCLRKDPSLHVPTLNLSLGSWQGASPEELMSNPFFLAFKALDDLNRTVIVVAAGNESLEVGAPSPVNIADDVYETYIDKGDYCYPASFGRFLKNMIVVGATDADDAAAEFTNWSEKYVDIAAPGVAIWSTVLSKKAENPNEPYGSDDGTSMAAPHVAGAVALLAAKYPDETASQLKERVLDNANAGVNPEARGYYEYYDGTKVYVQPSANVSSYKVSVHGLLDVGTAMNAAAPAPEPESAIAVTELAYDDGSPVNASAVTPNQEVNLTYTAVGSTFTFPLYPTVVAGSLSKWLTGSSSDDGYVSFVLEPGAQISYTVTATNNSTGEKSTLDQVFVATGTVPVPPVVPSGSGGGGCEVAGMFALAAVALLAMFRKGS